MSTATISSLLSFKPSFPSSKLQQPFTRNLIAFSPKPLTFSLTKRFALNDKEGNDNGDVLIGFDEEEKEARGKSTMPERFRYLSKEVPSPPVRWPWFVVLASPIPIPFFMSLNHMASKPCTVEEIFKDFRARRTALVRALTLEVDKLYRLCDPGKENLCLYGYPNETWEVRRPSAKAPAVLPEPVLGINISGEGVNRKDWLYFVAVHSVSWYQSK